MLNIADVRRDLLSYVKTLDNGRYGIEEDFGAWLICILFTHKNESHYIQYRIAPDSIHNWRHVDFLNYFHKHIISQIEKITFL